MKSLLSAGARVQAQLTVLAGFGGEGPIISALLEDLAPRIPDAVEFAWRHRVLLLRSADGFAVDVALGAMPFDEAAISRATTAELARGAVLLTCSAMDLVVHKAFAGRPQDLVDIEGVLVRQKGALLWPQIWADLTELAALKEAPELLNELERVARRAEAIVGTFERAR